MIFKIYICKNTTWNKKYKEQIRIKEDLILKSNDRFQMMFYLNEINSIKGYLIQW